jgi:GMP synthase-like glutamine amidotransferase
MVNNSNSRNNKNNFKILVVNLNQIDNSLHELEYIKPITQIIETLTNNSFDNDLGISKPIKQNKQFTKLNYMNLTEEIIKKYSHIILSGTSLKEFEYLNNLDKFEWIKTINQNKKQYLLGICAGCQIIQKMFKAKEIKFQEFGLYKLEILKQDIILENKTLQGDSSSNGPMVSNSSTLKEIYALHSSNFEVPDKFEIIAKTKIPQIIKYENIYGCLFHPEVRNKQIIKNFLNL